jgi:Zinc knuckle
MFGNNAYTNMTTVQPQEETPQRPRLKGPCFNCGNPSHYMRECRSLPSSNINFMDATEDEIQFVPQPTIALRINVANLKAQIDLLSTEENDSLIEMMGSTQDFTPA